MRGCWKTLCLVTWFCTMSHKQCLLWDNFCDHITLNIWLPYSLNCNHLDYHVWSVVEQETNKIPCNTKGKNNSSINQFKQGDHQKGFQEISKSSWDYGWSLWWFLYINFINSISSYVHVILVNISDKMSCQCYFHFCIT